MLSAGAGHDTTFIKSNKESWHFSYLTMTWINNDRRFIRFLRHATEVCSFHEDVVITKLEAKFITIRWSCSSKTRIGPSHLPAVGPGVWSELSCFDALCLSGSNALLGSCGISTSQVLGSSSTSFRSKSSFWSYMSTPTQHGCMGAPATEHLGGRGSCSHFQIQAPSCTNQLLFSTGPFVPSEFFMHWDFDTKERFNQPQTAFVGGTL